MKKPTFIIAALFALVCLFCGLAEAQGRGDGEKAAGPEIKAPPQAKKAGKKRRAKKRPQVIKATLEERQAALKAAFRRAGFSPGEIDGLLADQRLEIYHNIYPPPPPPGCVVERKKLGYFDEEFGLFKPESIAAGQKIIAAHRDVLAKIEQRYGVSAAYIVSIIRIETAFKEHLGKYSVFNALYTMSMLSKRTKRVQMANRELVVWVKMCRGRGLDPFAMKGSWAGAFGIPQFMPSSYITFAVDDNGDGVIDLYDYPDAFASIANYLHRVGWRTGNEKKMRRAVYNYNHEKAYVRAVFAYAERLQGAGKTLLPGPS